MNETGTKEILGAIGMLSGAVQQLATQMDTRFDAVDARFGALEGRVSNLEGGMITRDYFDRRMTKVENKVDKVATLLYRKEIFTTDDLAVVREV
ncbi:MAG TPA: hypothetical protein QF873_00695 [Patescibacteria group bacterium]|nr:hypothetical protein [Patescibacteria group bacterium]